MQKLQSAFTAVCLLCFASAPVLSAQDLKPANAETPASPETLMKQAEKLNGLSGGDLKPWHLKVGYDFLDRSGKATEHGTIEATWAAGSMVKITYSNSTSTLTYTTTEKGMYREGEVDERMALLQLVADAFVHPMVPFVQGRIQVTAHSMQTVSGQMRCLTLKSLVGVHVDFDDPTYCLDNTRPILRSISFPEDLHQFMWNHIGTFQNRYVPMEVLVGNANGTQLSAHLQMLQEVAKPDPADFIPSSKSIYMTPAHDTLVLPGDILEQEIRNNRIREVSCPQAKYPSEAKAANIRGTVRLRALIGTDGRIMQLHVINGPDLLRQAALDAVWRWKFEPPFHGSEHAQVLGEISVHF